MSHRLPAVLMLIAFAAACSGGGGALNELLDQVRLDDPLADTTYRQNHEAIEVPENVPTLIEVLAGDPSPKARQWAALLLGRIGDTQGVSALTAALGDGDNGVRNRAAAALTQMGDDVAEDAFIEALGADSREAQLVVLIELEKVASVKAIPAIITVARVDDGMVSKNATDALGGIGDVSAVGPLSEMAVDTGLSETLRRSAIMNLGRIPGPEATESLGAIITQLGEQEGAEALVQLARDQARAR